MNEKMSQADWQGVGESVKDLGRKLKEHANEAQDAIKTTSAPLSGVAAQVGAVFKTGMAKLDETVTDPAVGAAARGVAGKIQDSLKAQIGAEQPVESAAKKPEPEAEQSVSESLDGQGNDPKASPGT
jgi:hypothetical protein